MRLSRGLGPLVSGALPPVVHFAMAASFPGGAAQPAASRQGNVHQNDVNWRTDPRLEEARLQWERQLRTIAGIEEFLGDLGKLWERLSQMSDQQPLLAAMTGLLQSRRDAATTSDELRVTLDAAESSLKIYWRSFMKTAAEVLAEHERQAGQPEAGGAPTDARNVEVPPSCERQARQPHHGAREPAASGSRGAPQPARERSRQRQPRGDARESAASASGGAPPPAGELRIGAFNMGFDQGMMTARPHTMLKWCKHFARVCGEIADEGDCDLLFL